MSCLFCPAWSDEASQIRNQSVSVVVVGSVVFEVGFGEVVLFLRLRCLVSRQ